MIIVKRPTFLTVWLILLTLGALYTLYIDIAGSGSLTKTQINLSSWYSISSLVIGIAEVLAIVMLWMWKKIGFYIMVATAIIAVLIAAMVGGVAAGIAGSIVTIIGTLILYLAMRPVWQNFK